jgi:hypothetical protein
LTKAGGGARVPGFDTGDAGSGQRPEGTTLPCADEDHGKGDAGQVRGAGVQAAEPEHADGGDGEAGGEQQTVAESAGQPSGGDRDDEVDHGHREERDAGGEWAVALDGLQVLGDEEPEAHHRAEEQDPSGVGADALRTGEQPQRQNGLPGAPLVDQESSQQNHAGRERGDGDRVAPAT